MNKRKQLRRKAIRLQNSRRKAGLPKPSMIEALREASKEEQ